MFYKEDNDYQRVTWAAEGVALSNDTGYRRYQWVIYGRHSEWHCKMTVSTDSTNKLHRMHSECHCQMTGY